MDSLLHKRLAFIRAGMETKRYHVVPTLGANTVAHHSFGVAWLVWFLCQEIPHLGYAYYVNVIMAALAHDLAEHIMGDLPADAKRRLPNDVRGLNDITEQQELRAQDLYYELDDVQQRILKFADCADGALFCCRERAMGNKLITPTYYNYISYLHQLNPQLGPEADVMAFIVDEWSKANG